MHKRIAIYLALAALLSLALLNTALAHAKLVSSDPAAGARLTKAPAKITLVFSEEISAKETESFFTVTDEKGASVGTGKLDTNDLDHKTLSGALKTGLGDGVYTIAWEAVTSDDNGHSEGSLTFGVNKDPGAQPTAVPDEEEETPTATSASAAPTTAPTSAPRPTAAPAGGSPSTLPTTAEGEPDVRGIALLAAAVALAAGLALLRSRARSRR